MVDRSNRVRSFAVATLVVLVATIAGGCSALSDNVELNGKIFDAVGLSGGALGKKAEVRTEARAPLVLPPDAERLPEPGAAPQPAVADQAWPRDAQKQKVASAEARKRAHEQHCRDGNWKQKAMKDEISADQGPDGSCNGSLFSIMGNALFGSSD